MARKVASKEDHQWLFREAPVWHAIFHMAIPAMISMLVVLLYNMADMFFVGRIGDNAQVAAVSLVSPIFTLTMAMGSLLGGGGSAVIARTLGQQDAKKVQCYSSLCCWASLIFGGIFGFVLLLGAETVLGLLGANAEIWGYAHTYMSILAVGAPIMIFTSAYGNIIRAEGAVRQAMRGNLMSTITNIVLDPIFILRLNMGVGGAAAATVIGNVVGAAYIIRYVRKESTTLSFALKDAMQKPSEIGTILVTGLPNATSNTLTSVANAVANNLLVPFGTVAVAAQAASGKSTMMISMIQMGLCMGIQPLMAYNYGARNTKRLQEIIRKIAILTLSVGVGLMLFCSVNSYFVINLFLKDPEALELGQRMIRLRVLTGPFLGMFYISTNFLQASGKPETATFVSLLRQGILLLPMLFVMNQLFGVTGNICAHIAADIGAAFMAVIFAVRQYRSQSAPKDSL